MALTSVPWNTPGLRLTSAVCLGQDYNEYLREFFDVVSIGEWRGTLNGKRVIVEPPDELDEDNIKFIQDIDDYQSLMQAMREIASKASVDLKALGFRDAITATSFAL